TRRPTLSPWYVTVSAARTAAPGTRPVSASTPDGTSTATTGPVARPIQAIASATGPSGAPREPVPSSASTTTTPSPGGSPPRGATAIPSVAAIRVIVAASGVAGSRPSGASTRTPQPASARCR